MRHKRRLSLFLAAAALFGGALSIVSAFLAFVSTLAKTDPHTTTILGMLSIGAITLTATCSAVYWFSPEQRAERRKRREVVDWLRSVNGLPLSKQARKPQHAAPEDIPIISVIGVGAVLGMIALIAFGYV